MDGIRGEFPVLRPQTYLNTAVYGPLHESLANRSLFNISNDIDFIHFVSPSKDHGVFVYLFNAHIDPFLEFLFAIDPDMCNVISRAIYW